MDPSLSLGKICLGENVVEISSDKVEESGDWDSLEYQTLLVVKERRKQKLWFFTKWIPKSWSGIPAYDWWHSQYPERHFLTFNGFCHQTFRAARSDVMRNTESDSDDEEEYEIKRNKFRASIYGPKPTPYLNFNDQAERSLALHTITNPFWNISVWKKAASFLCSLPEEMMLKPDHQDPNALDNLKPWKKCCFHKFTMNSCYGEVATMRRSLARVLTNLVLRRLSASTYYRDFDTTTLRELIDSEGRLILEDSQPDVLRIGIPRPQRASMQDLYQGVFEHMAGVYSVPLQGAYNPPSYAQPQYDQYYQQIPISTTTISIVVSAAPNIGKQEKERGTYKNYLKYEESRVRIKCRSISKKKKKSNYSSFQDLRSICNEDMVKYEGTRPSTTRARALNEKSNKKIPPMTSQPPDWRVCHMAGGHVGRGTIIQIFYHGLDEPIQAILDVGGIFLYKTLNEAYQLLEDRVLLKLDWSKGNKAKPFRKIIAFAESDENSPLLEKMEALTTRIDSQFKEIRGDMKEMRDGCNKCGGPHPLSDSDDKPMEDPRRWKQTMHPEDIKEIIMVEILSIGAIINITVEMKTKTQTLNHQAVTQDLETKFGRISDHQSSRPPANLDTKTIVYLDDSEDEAEEVKKEAEPLPKKPTQTGTPPFKAYKPKIPYLQRLNKEKMEARYAKFLDMIKEVRINVPLVDVLAGMPNYGKFLKDLVSNKSFVILEIEEDDRVPLILGRPFLHNANAIIRVMNKEPNLGIREDRATFHINKAIQHSYVNDGTCFRIDVIDEITEDKLDDLLDDSKPFLNTAEKISKTPLDNEFNEFMSGNVQ
uniref:Reverse transcriptase domain-containing protein n=1 Tax=Tanacetum cinerariifolium TaxID=118510 RepID=A0A6L2JUS1_TANCI|nr:reverse transcriptase domain-containing protein [Tanacetum cinerariifolium]